MQFRLRVAYRIANSEDLVVTVPPSTGKMRGPEMNGQPIPKEDDSTAKPATRSANINASVIEELVAKFRNQESLTEQVYEHVGEPLYFTDQRGAISTNHNMFYVYRSALP